MTPPTFILANPTLHREALVRINIEYMSWVIGEMEKCFGLTALELIGMPVPEYAQSMIDKVCGDVPPHGAFYLVEQDGELVGMGGLRRIRDGVAEIKRVYVRAAHRGKHLGEAVLQRVVGDAKAFGYRSIVLDSGPFMQSAQHLYRAAGFVDRLPYPETEVPVALHQAWCFMERAL